VLFKILPKCLFVIIVIHAYFIHISQSSVEMHLRCGGTYNNHIIANCPQSVPVKEFWKSVINWQRLLRTKVKCHIFYGPPCMYRTTQVAYKVPFQQLPEVHFCWTWPPHKKTLRKWPGN